MTGDRPLRGTVLIDAHHHFWALGEGRYDWIHQRLDLPNMERLARDFEIEDFRPVIDSASIGLTLLVQTEQTAAETEQMLVRARQADFVAGVVGWIDFAAPDAAMRMMDLAKDPIIRGVRLWLAGRNDVPVLLDAPSFRAALAVLDDRNLTLEVLSRPEQIGMTGDLLAMLADPARLVISHAAKPEIDRWAVDGSEFTAWAGGMQALGDAGCSVKLSGLMTECGDDWRIGDLAPYWDVMLETFGPYGMIWGSDWPVIERAGGYRRWLGAVKELAAPLTTDERSAIFGGNAARIYGLSVR